MSKTFWFALTDWTRSPGMLQYRADHPRLYHVVTAVAFSLALGVPVAALSMIAMLLLL